MGRGFEGLTGPLEWRLTAYRNDVDSLIQSESNYPYRNYNVGKALIKGVEFTGEMDTWVFIIPLTCNI